MEDIKPAMREAKSMVFRASSFAQVNDPLLSWPYRAARAAAWMETDNLPAEEGGITRIPPPSPDIARLLASMEERGAWAEQLKLAETRFKDTPFWLDLNRFSVKAMTALGPGYRNGANAIKSELSKLLTCLPRLIELQFSDGTPFADGQTRSWIESEILGGEGKGAPASLGPAPSQGIEDEGFEEVKSKAKALINEGKLKEGIGLFHKALSESPSKKSRFLITLEMSRTCLESNQIKMAVSYLEKLDDEIRRFSLEEWEPALSGETLQTYWFSLGKQFQEIKPPSPEIAKQIEEVYKRICRLDPMAAIDLDQKKKGGWLNR
jgi:type VI secretion system protein VasJ